METTASCPTGVASTESVSDHEITPKQEKRIRHKLQRFTKKYGTDLFAVNPADIRALGTVDGMMERYFTPQKLSFDPSHSSDYVLKVKLQLLTLKARALDLIPGIFLKEVSQKMSTYGLVHAALQIGPYRFDWTPDSFSFPRPIFNDTHPILMLDLPKGILYCGKDWKSVEKICRKICEVAVRWNCNKEYGIKNHCQRFVYELLVVLRILSGPTSPSSPTSPLSPRSEEDDDTIPPTSVSRHGSSASETLSGIGDLGFQEPISSFLEYLHKHGTSAMRYRPPPPEPLDENGERSEGEEWSRETKDERRGSESSSVGYKKDVLIFTTHEELDRYTRKLLKRNPKFREQYPHHWQLLKAFDRAFWAASVELKQLEEERWNEDRERQAKETLEDLRRMRQLCKQEQEKLREKEGMGEQERQREEERKKKQKADERWKRWRGEVERQARETLEDLYRLREEERKKQLEDEANVASMQQQDGKSRKGSVRKIKKILKFGAAGKEQEAATQAIDMQENGQTRRERRLTRSFSDSDMDKDSGRRKGKKKKKEEEEKKKLRRKRSGRKGKKGEKDKEKEKLKEKRLRRRKQLDQQKQRRKSMRLPVRYFGEAESSRWETLAVRSAACIGELVEHDAPETGELGGFVMKIDPKTVILTCPFGSPLDFNASFSHIAYRVNKIETRASEEQCAQ